MQYFPATLTKHQTLKSINKYKNHFNEYGFTYFAIETLNNKKFIGFCGLLHQQYISPFTPAIDIGWRLKKTAWGKGFATEAATACLQYASTRLGITKVISVSAHTNKASINVMKKIGMKYQGSFSHPSLKQNSPLNPCDVYAITF